jgi:hypothetical protein
MLIRSLALAATLAISGASGSVQAETARCETAIEAAQTKIPPPARPNDGCYYGTKCVPSQRYGQICWRVLCPRTTPTIAR